MSEQAELLRHLFDAALKAADPTVVLKSHLPPQTKGKTIVVGAGKASALMAQALEQRWHGPLSGLVVVPYGHTAPCHSVEIVEASHPVPDENGEKAARRILSLVKGLSDQDLVIALISGGGSALLTLPTTGIGLSDKQAVNRLLLESGIAISDMNVVRKHLSQIKGGRLSLAAWPAQVATLAISDVPGDEPSLIASGPTVGDPSTLDQVKRILSPFYKTLPPSVKAAISQAGNETPKPDDPKLSGHLFRLIATPKMSLDAAAKAALAFGIKPVILGDALEGEALELGKTLAQKPLSAQSSGACNSQPIVFLSGGETTVTLSGATPDLGIGGRNVEFLLGLTKELNAQPGIFALACDTDGVDGTAPVAGAITGPDTLARAKAANYPIDDAIARHDGHGFFAATDSQIITGPTLTNVNDFRAILVYPDQPNVR